MIPDYSLLMPSHPNWHRLGTLRILNSDPNVIDLGAWAREARDPLVAIVTVDLYDRFGQAGHWLHLSFSRRGRLPSWPDLVSARDELGYGERVFVQMLPPKTFWLNVHPYCLHMVSRLDGETVPRQLWDQVGCDGAAYRGGQP